MEEANLLFSAIGKLLESSEIMKYHFYALEALGIIILFIAVIILVIKVWELWQK